MPSKPRKQRNSNSPEPDNTPARPKPQRDAQGKWLKGSSGLGTVDVARARKTLNQLTIDGLSEAFRRGGKAAIDKVMKNAPAQFLKLCVLLVPRELEVTRATGAKGMSDEQLAAAVEAIERYLSRRGRALPPPTVIEGEAVSAPDASPLLPQPDPTPDPT